MTGDDQVACTIFSRSSHMVAGLRRVRAEAADGAERDPVVAAVAALLAAFASAEPAQFFW